MHKHINALLLACAALSLAACSLEPFEPAPPPRHPGYPPSRQQIPEPPSPQPRPNDLPDWTRNGQSSSRTPVAGLLDAARKEQQAGDFDHAEATLERALRIAPYDAEVLTELADVKLALGHGPQAAALANKSNGLVRDDPSLRARNDQIISAARRMSGE